MKKAKDFKVLNHRGEEVSLSSFKGKLIWLAFFRYASCPLCNLHLHNILKQYEQVRAKDIVFFPVFQSSVEDVMKYAGSIENLPFNILCDPGEKLYQLYNVESSVYGFFSLSVFKKAVQAMWRGLLPGKVNGKMARLPSEFLIDQSFNIRYRYQGSNIGDHPEIKTIFGLVDIIQNGN